MSLSKFDYTREGSAQARDYRNNPYPTNDFNYGEVETPGHPPRRIKRQRYRYLRDTISSWTRDRGLNPNWESLPLNESLVNTAWSLNRNELAVLRYISMYPEWNGVNFSNPLPYMTACKYGFPYQDKKDIRLIECGYLTTTPTIKAGVYARRLYMLGLLDKKSWSWYSSYRINPYGNRVIEIRK